MPNRVHDRQPPLTVGELFSEHASFVWRLLRRLGVPESDAEDVCQDVFVVVHRKLAEFEPRAAHRTWIFGIATRVASEYRRSARVRREELTDSPPEEHTAENADEVVERRRRLAWLDSILDGLDHDRRAVFVLYEIEELPMRSVAELVGCPLQTAYSRLKSARKHIEHAAQKLTEESP